MINDYAEQMTEIKNAIPKLSDALSRKKWHEAKSIAEKIKKDLSKVIEFSENKMLK